MKRKDVKKILITQTKRRSAIVSFSFAIILIVLLSATFFTIYNFKSKAIKAILSSLVTPFIRSYDL